MVNGGKLILYPTDTIWGIGCDATNPNSVEKIISLKNRPDKKSFVILVSDLSQLSVYAEMPSNEMLEFSQKSTKPVTFILNHKSGIAPNAINENNTIAVRIPDDDFCITLLQQFGKPIISTSANISGEPTPAIFKEINERIVTGVDYTVRYKQEVTVPGESSSIIMQNDEGQLIILRR